MQKSGDLGPFRFSNRFFSANWWRVLLWGLAALIAVVIGLLAWKWPFARKTVVTALEHESGRIVRLGSFHGTLFPPGYVAYNLVLTKSGTAKDGQDAVTIRRMTIVSSWIDLLLLRKRIQLAWIEGVRMPIPSIPPGQEQSKRRPGENQPRFAEIGQVKLDDVSFTFPSAQEASDPFTIRVQSINFDRVNRRSESRFHARLGISEPDSTIRSEGVIGPWNWNDPGRTPLSGSFVVERADLGVLNGIRGTFTGSGRFRGPLQQVECGGTLDVPQFQVGAAGSNSAHLSATFQVTVNGLNGDTKLDHVESRLNRTLIESDGTVMSDGERPGKAAVLHFLVERGHIEDFLFLFTHKKKPAMTGQLSLRANVEIPSGPPGFLKKVTIVGGFDITAGRFTNQRTQTEINHLSKSSEGMSKGEEKADPTIVLSDIKGQVVVKEGTATLSHAAVTAPGAQAALSGTSSLVDFALDLHGVLRTTGKLADTTSGLKTALLTLATPFWKKKSMTVVPFTITGTMQNPAFALDLVKK